MSIVLPPLRRAAIERIGDWVRANLAPRRTRAVLVALAFALGASGLVLIDTRDREIRRELADKESMIARMAQIGPTDVWHQRRAESQMWRLQAEARLWEADTDGLAQANFQSWIADQASQAGIRVSDMRSSINPTPDNPLKLRKITTLLVGPFDADAFFKLLQTVAAQQRIVVVERLEIQVAPVPRFEMVLGAFLRPAKA